MRKTIKITILIATMGFFLVSPSTLNAHCQVPCGIYNDNARLQSMLEDAATIEKAARLINELAGKQDAQSQNQLVRWVNTKEIHAQNIIETISNYYLTQRVKPSQNDYTERLEKHHAVIVTAMKAKQNVDAKTGASLVKNIKALSGYYPEHKH
jgi:nickel superoxide dismutase